MKAPLKTAFDHGYEKAIADVSARLRAFVQECYAADEGEGFWKSVEAVAQEIEKFAPPELK